MFITHSFVFRATLGQFKEFQKIHVVVTVTTLSGTSIYEAYLHLQYGEFQYPLDRPQFK